MKFQGNSRPPISLEIAPKRSPFLKLLDSIALDGIGSFKMVRASVLSYIIGLLPNSIQIGNIRPSSCSPECHQRSFPLGWERGIR